MAIDPEVMTNMLHPSGEVDFYKDMLRDCIEVYKTLCKQIPEELLGPRFEFGMYFRARMSILSRVFQTPVTNSALVPVVDFFNHGTSPGASWGYSEESHSMTLVA